MLLGRRILEPIGVLQTSELLARTEGRTGEKGVDPCWPSLRRVASRLLVDLTGAELPARRMNDGLPERPVVTLRRAGERLRPRRAFRRAGSILERLEFDVDDAWRDGADPSGARRHYGIDLGGGCAGRARPRAADVPSAGR